LIANAFRQWAYAGGLLAAALLILDWFRPFPAEVNFWIEKATYALCPAWTFGLTTLAHNGLQRSFLTVVVNLAAYGLLGVVVYFFRRVCSEIMFSSSSSR
jgi:hypothetical protein